MYVHVRANEIAITCIAMIRVCVRVRVCVCVCACVCACVCVSGGGAPDKASREAETGEREATAEGGRETDQQGN